MSNSGKRDSLKEEPGGNLVDADDWLIAYQNSIKNVDELSQFIYLDEKKKCALRRVVEIYHMRIPQYYFSLIKEDDNPLNPISRQCIPSVEEIREEINEKVDPLGEEKTSPTPYLVHRYPDRILLLVTGRCFMYCRHCTRKRLWKSRICEFSLQDIADSLDYVKTNKNIREIIVSGGDPLTLSTEKIDYILSRIKEISNITVVRIGTRAPVVMPQRIDDDLCAALEKYNNLWINVQFNHPWEITEESTLACRKLQRCGIPLSNQSVLLKGVNDDVQVMTELCQKLQDIRVRPYYLFQCDPVVGTGHFRASLSEGVDILRKMRGYTSGMCIPNFVIDGTDGRGKIPLAPNYLVSQSEEGMLLRNYRDELFFYPEPQKLGKSAKKKAIQSVGIIFNSKKNNNQSDEEEEYDEVDTIESIKEEIKKLGFTVSLFEQTSGLADNLSKERPDFVINMAEGLGVSRARESQVPCILESLKIPYSGSDAIALGISLDKYLTNILLKSWGIPVPQAFMVENLSQTIHLQNIFQGEKLFIVKPRWEGSSRGIFLNSVVNNFPDLCERIKNIHLEYYQPALVEEFIEKDEITVGVCGNASPRLLGMMRIVPKEESSRPFFYSLETKRQWQEEVSYQPQTAITFDIQNLVKRYALAAYRALELKDLARIDFRVGSDNIPRIIDVNPLPGLSPRYSDLPILYRLVGRSYSELIKTLLRESFKRHGFRWQ